jgi:hypothetical protein
MPPAQRRTVAVLIGLFLTISLLICWLSYVAETYYDHVEIIDSSRYSSVQVLLNDHEFNKTLEPAGLAPPLNLGWLHPDDTVVILVNSQNEAGDDRVEAVIDGRHRIITEEGFITGDVVRPPDELVVLCSFTASGVSTDITGACDARCPWHCPTLPLSLRTSSVVDFSWQSRAFELATGAKPFVLVILGLLGAVVLILHDVQQVRADRALGRTKKRTWFAGLVTVVSLVSGALTIAGVIGYARGLLLVAVLGVIALVVWITELLLDDLIVLAVKAESASLVPSNGSRHLHRPDDATDDGRPTERREPTSTDDGASLAAVRHSDVTDGDKQSHPHTRRTVTTIETQESRGPRAESEGTTQPRRAPDQPDIAKGT